MEKNRGPLGFPRLTDRGPFVKKENDFKRMPKGLPDPLKLTKDGWVSFFAPYRDDDLVWFNPSREIYLRLVPKHPSYEISFWDMSSRPSIDLGHIKPDKIIREGDKDFDEFFRVVTSSTDDDSDEKAQWYQDRMGNINLKFPDGAEVYMQGEDDVKSFLEDMGEDPDDPHLDLWHDLPDVYYWDYHNVAEIPPGKKERASTEYEREIRGS